MVARQPSSTLQTVGALLVTVISSVIMIVLSILYFMLTIWVIRVGASWAGAEADGNMIVLTAGIVTAAILLGSALQRR
ncbi:MAG: hypothetical protein ACMXYF_00570 [Candidatus Woesearchaeota archaeon]